MAIMANTIEQAPAIGALPRFRALRGIRGAVVSVACGAGAVALITTAAFNLHLNLTTAALLHLIVVVLIARYLGFWAASGVSLIAVVCQLYFLVPPVFTFAVADPQNWISLAAFEYCALIVSSLSGQATRQTLVARRRQEETEGLYEISRLMLLMDRRQEPGPQLIALIQSVFHCETSCLFDAGTTHFATGGATPLCSRNQN